MTTKTPDVLPQNSAVSTVAFSVRQYYICVKLVNTHKCKLKHGKYLLTSNKLDNNIVKH